MSEHDQKVYSFMVEHLRQTVRLTGCLSAPEQHELRKRLSRKLLPSVAGLKRLADAISALASAEKEA